MNSFYNIIDKIKEVITAEPFNNEISFGDIADIDLKKQSLFPLAHVMINNCLLYTSPSPRDRTRSRMPSSA